MRIIFDLYAPALVEAAANLAEEQGAERSGGIRYDEVVAVTRVLAPARRRVPLRQRAAARPLAGGSRRSVAMSRPELYARDAALRSLVAVVPFGLDPAPPSPGPGW